MDIKVNAAAQGYVKALAAAAPDPQAGNAETGFAGMAASFADTLAEGERTARSALTGGADPHALVQALASSQMAVDTVVTVRDRMVEAYQEILRMPV